MKKKNLAVVLITAMTMFTACVNSESDSKDTTEETKIESKQDQSQDETEQRNKETTAASKIENNQGKSQDETAHKNEKTVLVKETLEDEDGCIYYGSVYEYDESGKQTKQIGFVLLALQ